MSNPIKKKSVVWEWTESIVVALVLAIFIRFYFIQPFKIPSGSMRMTLIEGDHLFSDKLSYGPTLLPEMHSIELGVINIDFEWPDFLIPLTKIRLPGFSKPKRGDIMIFTYPGNRKQNFIKRLIGLPGETVEIKDGKILINGQEVTDPRIANTYYYNYGDYGQEDVPITVPAGHYFMMGDNSGSSNDSRYWGFIDEKDVVAKADLLFWPLTRIRLIQ